jgi:hypothetical protein
VLLADTLVEAARHEQVDRFRVRIRRVEVAARIKREAEWIRLPVRHNLETRAVGPKPIRVAARDFHRAPAAVHDLAGVRKSMRSVDPAVEPQPVARRHAVRVLETETVVEFLPHIRPPVAVGVREPPDRRNRIHERRVALRPRRARQRQHPDGNVQPVGKHRHLPRPPRRRIEIREHAHRVESVLHGLRRRRRRAKREIVIVPIFLKRRDRLTHRIAPRRPRIERRPRYPHAPGGIERHVHRLLNLRLRRDELNLKSRRHMKQHPLFLRRAQPRIRRIPTRIGGESRRAPHTGQRGERGKNGETARGVIGVADEETPHHPARPVAIYDRSGQKPRRPSINSTGSSPSLHLRRQKTSAVPAPRARAVPRGARGASEIAG